MSYIEKNLLPGETVVYSASRHWVVAIFPVVIAIFFLLIGITPIIVDATSKGRDRIGGAGFSLIFVAFSGVLLLMAFLRLRTIRMAVTSRRIIVKQGLLRTRSIDISHKKVESIQVDQGLLGKMLGYGTVIVRGIGGTPEPFSKISYPFEFRRQVQTYTDPA